MENWSLFFQAGTFGIALAGFICSFLWFVLSLKIKPMQEDVSDIKQQMAQKMKSEDELTLFFLGMLKKHKEECQKAKE